MLQSALTKFGIEQVAEGQIAMVTEGFKADVLLEH